MLVVVVVVTVAVAVAVIVLTQVNPRQLIASASMSPSREGKEFSAGKYACM
jgi:hypothetical protein